MLLKGALHLAVMANVIGSNPVRRCFVRSGRSRVRRVRRRLGRTSCASCSASCALRSTARERSCPPITIFIANGLRRSELLGLRWSDFDEKAGTVAVTGKVIRAAGKSLVRVEEAKTAAGRRMVPDRRLNL